MEIVGTWVLKAWCRYGTDGTLTQPFGESPQGLLIYTPDGNMAVQMVKADRPPLNTSDALGGTADERAGAYSTCLAYYGRYRLDGQRVIHLLEGSLFPNWAGTQQIRPFVYDGHQLILQVKDDSGRVTNEIFWVRRDPSPAENAPQPTPAPSPEAAAQLRLEALIKASARLTGFDQTTLLGTGVAEEYQKTLEAIVPDSVLTSLFSCISSLPATPAGDEALSAKVLADPDLGPVARSLMVLWYTGSWSALPASWQARHGQSDLDTDRVVSVAAFQAGLQWKVVGAHPPGAHPQGFGSWSLPPEGGTL